MRVVDTSVWIETLVGSRFGQDLLRELPAEDEWLMPTIVQLEISKWLLRETQNDLHDRIIAFSMTLQLIPLDASIALEAALLCRTLRLATADAIVLASARVHHAELLTCDSHFEGIPGVLYRAKPKDL